MTPIEIRIYPGRAILGETVYWWVDVLDGQRIWTHQQNGFDSKDSAIAWAKTVFPSATAITEDEGRRNYREQWHLAQSDALREITYLRKDNDILRKALGIRP